MATSRGQPGLDLGDGEPRGARAGGQLPGHRSHGPRVLERVERVDERAHLDLLDGGAHRLLRHAHGPRSGRRPPPARRRCTSSTRSARATTSTPSRVRDADDQRQDPRAVGTGSKRSIPGQRANGAVAARERTTRPCRTTSTSSPGATRRTHVRVTNSRPGTDEHEPHDPRRPGGVGGGVLVRRGHASSLRERGRRTTWGPRPHLEGWGHAPSPRLPSHLPLFWTICLINGVVFVVGALLLVLSPASVSSDAVPSEIVVVGARPGRDAARPTPS